MQNQPPPYIEKPGPPPPEYASSNQYPPAPSYPPAPGQYPAYPPPPQVAYPQQPNPPYAPPPPTSIGQTTVVVTQPVVVQGAVYRGVPVSVTCPHCRAQVVTAITYSSGLLAWLLCLGLVLLGCWVGCCLIPFCIDDLKDATHSCPNCRQVLGHYRRI